MVISIILLRGNKKNPYTFFPNIRETLEVSVKFIELFVAETACSPSFTSKC